MPLFDYAGRPVQQQKLTKEVASPSVQGVRTWWYDSVANALTPERLATIITEVDENDNLNFLTLANEMLERDLHFASVVGSRINAIAGLDVMVEAASDDAEDVKIRDFVALAIDDDAFTPMVRAEMDGVVKGYSVSEIMWDRSEAQWMPMEYKWRDPRFFQFDRETGEEIRLRSEEDLAEGVPLQPYKFIYHRPELKTGLPIRCGLARLAVVAYMCKGFVWKDWLAFMEVFGMPLRVGKFDTTASTEQKAALLNAVATIGSDAACIIPDSMMIEFVAAQKTAGGEDLFEKAANFFDKQVSKAVVGQTASTEGTPGRLGAEDSQENVRADIKAADATQLEATLRRDLIKPLVDLNFGPRPRRKYPFLRLVIEEPEDLELLSKSLAPLVDRGLKVQSSLILDKFNLPEAEEGAETLQPEALTAAGLGGSAPEEKTVEREQREVVVELMRRVRQGETLTVDQRLLLTATFAAETAQRQATTVQTVILSKERFKTIEAARKWVADHDYHATKVDENQTSYRFRQRDPGDFKPNSLRTIKLTDGVSAVIGRLKAEKAQAETEPPNDDIDDLADDELDGWQRLMDPVLQPVLDHAKASGNYQEFLGGLEGVLKEMDSTEFMESLAIETFKARGLGDGTDDL